MDSAPITDPERQFLGCLLSLPHTAARTVLTEMRASDVADPAGSHVLQLVIETVAEGADPTPAVVFSHALSSGQAPGEARRSRLALWLAETYEAAQLPAQASWLKAVVLERAWRRAVAEHAARVAQAAEESATDVLAGITADTATADELWNRYQRALDGDNRQARRAGLGVAA